MNVIADNNYRPAVGNFFDWLKTAASNVSNTIKDVAPVIQQARQTVGPSTGVVAPSTNIYSGQATWQQPAYQAAPKKDNTMLYLGIGAAAVVAIILLNKK